MFNQQSIGWMYLCILSSSAILPILCYPSHQDGSKVQPHLVLPEGRKFNEKPNATKKVQPVENRNDLQDVETNTIQTQDSPFSSWSNMIGMIMQLIFQGNQTPGPSKSDAIDADQNVNQSPWTNLLTMGLKILGAFLTGNSPQNDGIDKVDNSNSPMQTIFEAFLSAVLGTKDQGQVTKMASQATEFVNIVFTLLDALKTSFSHRAIAARSLGKTDRISDTAIASISMLKGYMRSMKTSNDACAKKYICDAYRECADGLNSSSPTYCQLGGYAASAALHKSTGIPLKDLYDAGRTARNGEDCKQVYQTCNEA